MKYFSTFSGIGGFEIGIQNAWIAHLQEIGRGQKNSQGDDEIRGDRLHPVSSKSSNTKNRRADEHAHGVSNPGQPTCVGFSEIDPYAIKVYEKRFGGIKNYGDITKINEKELPDFDCLVGGFPCQAFSIAGKRAGFEDTRGTLFFDLARILRAKQPRLFVFENVKGLLSHDSGRTFKTIIQTIDELGYDCQWQVLNSKNFGVPQNRERIIIVGHLRGTPRPEVFPIRENAQVFAERQRKISPTITSRYYKQGQSDPYIVDESKPRIRKLTPLECERLQAFPDDWTKYGENEQGVRVPISDTQRYKMAGNAVTTNVIQAVFEKIFKEEL